ncbi:uncharacterized protein LOC122853040 [Aphidius gifuensis]|uniref:uncharacterized protein LOC122853040 n=1 Tax=Aphidius gifuensis TaxID=684658 RepID=UPI001CDC5501|nr:uncharacterized protein LOC122853040 [Aphidius gifuensis]
MDSVAVTVPLRPPTKKMKKRKELDALAPSHVISRRTSGKRSSQELLTDSSDERSEYWNVSIRGNRKARARRGRSCPGLFRACNAFFGCASVLATASLIWLFIDVRQQLTSLRVEVDQVIAGSDGVQDTLQKCHSLSKELQNNQTFLYTQLADVKLQIANFTTQLSSLQPELHQVQELLNRAPELTNVPKDLNNILNSVATFGSKIEDLKSTADGLKIVDQKLQDAQNIIQNNITEIKTSLTELSHITRGPELLTNASKIKTDELSQAISKLQIDLTNITETLTKKLTWLQNDRENDKKKLDSMMDNNLNVTVTLESLRGQCAKISEHEKLLNATIMTVNDQVKNIHTLDLNARINKMEQNYSHLKNTTDVILNSINDINNNSKVSGQGQTTRNTTQS